MNKYPDSGIMSDNTYKQTEKQPDFTGRGEYKGVEFRIAGWKRTGQNGDFISLKFSEPQQQVAKQEPKAQEVYDSTNDELPF